MLTHCSVDNPCPALWADPCRDIVEDNQLTSHPKVLFDVPRWHEGTADTDRRAARPWARLARSGARPAVSGPTVHEAAMRALPRARADAIRARPDAQGRRQAFWLRHERRSTVRAHWGPARLRGLARPP